MQLANSAARYGAIPQAVHWLTAICVAAGWLLGQFIDDFAKGAPQNAALLAHMTLGQCVIVLLMARLVWRLANPPPPAEKTRFGRPLEIAAKVSHFTLYGLLLATPLLGVIVQLKRGHALPVLGLWDVHSPWPTDRAQAKALLGVHSYLADALLILAGIHAAAALIHHYALRDRTLLRMMPGAASGAA
jgi:cytochrome b561